MSEYVIRFLIGGVVVSAFSLLGSLFKPRTFAGLFGAAPSVALATLALTFHKEGAEYASVEGRSMLAGAVALLAYSLATWWFVKRRDMRVLPSASVALPVWFAVAFAVWFVGIR